MRPSHLPSALITWSLEFHHWFEGFFPHETVRSLTLCGDASFWYHVKVIEDYEIRILTFWNIRVLDRDWKISYLVFLAFMQPIECLTNIIFLGPLMQNVMDWFGKLFLFHFITMHQTSAVINNWSSTSIYHFLILYGFPNLSLESHWDMFISIGCFVCQLPPSRAQHRSNLIDTIHLLPR